MPVAAALFPAAAEQRLVAEHSSDGANAVAEAPGVWAAVVAAAVANVPYEAGADVPSSYPVSICFRHCGYDQSRITHCDESPLSYYLFTFVFLSSYYHLGP